MTTTSNQPRLRDKPVLRIEAEHFVAGIEVRNGVVWSAPPLLKGMLGKSIESVIAYCEEKGWRIH